MNDDDYFDDDEDFEELDVCEGCGCDFSEEHDWDCPYADDDEDEE